MQGILADHNVVGHVNDLLVIWKSSEWQETWSALNIPILHFADLGLNEDDSDTQVWQACQRANVCLITGNRNKKGRESLEETVRTLNEATSLPVFTLGDPDRLIRDRAYAERTATKLLEYFMEIDTVRGTGRLYVP